MYPLRRARVDHVGALCCIGRGHTSGILLHGGGGHRHPRGAHRVAAQEPGENIEMAVEVTDIMLPTVGGQALWERLVDIQGASSPDIIQRS